MENAAPVAATPSQPRRRSPLMRFLIGRNLAFTISRVIVWVVLFGLVFKYVLLGIRVTGQSMEPTYRSGQIKFVNRIAYRHAPPKRLDVVAVASPTLKNVLILKRILGLPGERIAIRNGIIYINGEPLKETYVKGTTSLRTWREQTLQPREYFVIGDNRDVTDAFLVYENQIVGRVIGSHQ
jgi:signal peptidase I